MSSSPQSIHDISPVRRRSVSSDVSDLRAPRHSSPVARPFDPNDPQAMERQRTMDADMAMHLSLARGDPSYSPVTPFASPVVTTSPFDPSHIHGVSTPEPTIHLDQDNSVLQDQDHLSHTDHRFEHQDDIPHVHLPHPIDPSIVSGGAIHEAPSSLNFGLPSYQPNASQFNIDFSPMEDFATAEKVKLGLNSALTPKFVFPTRRPKVLDKPKVPSTQSIPTSSVVDGPQHDGTPDNGDASAAGQSSPKALRLRKLSQSNPQPRPQRRGIGVKMALFEGGAQESPFNLSARLGVTSGGQGGPATNSSYENIVGPNVTGILNTGHDRPYRFSFYSNALSATIHARSLSELPAEGQTFEQLFSGIQPQPQEGDIRPASPAPSNHGRDRPSSSMNAPPYHDPAKGLVNNSNHHSNKRGGGLDGPNAFQGDVNTWWLDVLSPTDEEMKMLSKVRLQIRNFDCFIQLSLRYSASTLLQRKISLWRRLARRLNFSATIISSVSALSIKTRTVRPTWSLSICTSLSSAKGSSHSTSDLPHIRKTFVAE